MCSSEFDRKKSQSNKAKHGISFDETQLTWEDPDLLEVQAKSDDESRYLVIGKIAKKY